MTTVLSRCLEAATRDAGRSVGRSVGRPVRRQAGRSVGRWVGEWEALPDPSQSGKRLAEGGGPSVCPYYKAMGVHRSPTQRLPILQSDGRASLSGQPCFERLVLSFSCCILSRQTEVAEPSIFLQACNASRSLRSTRLPAGRACSRPLAPRQQRRSLCPR